MGGFFGALDFIAMVLLFPPNARLVMGECWVFEIYISIGTTAVVKVQSWLADGLPTTFPTLNPGEMGAGEIVGLLREEYSTMALL